MERTTIGVMLATVIWIPPLNGMTWNEVRSHSARTCECFFCHTALAHASVFFATQCSQMRARFLAVATKVVQGLGKRFLGGTYIQGRAVKQREQNFSTNAAVLVVLGMDSRDDHATMAPDAFLKTTEKVQFDEGRFSS